MWYSFFMIFRRFTAFAVLVGVSSSLFSAYPVSAQITLDTGFDPNMILHDDDVFDVNAMSKERLIAFLKSKGTLASIKVMDSDGIEKTPADIIWRVATTYKINPKYLLVLLQKEQSLVEDPDPSQKQLDWAAGYGVCDSCSKDDPSIQDFKGFAAQVEWASRQHREKYLMQLLGNGQTIAGQAPGKTIVIDGLSVTPANNATAMLYSYTPHLHGNLNLWRIWRRWFSLKFPDGTVVRGKTSGDVYLIRLGEKRKFASKSVLESLVDPDKVLEIADTELSAYPDGPEIRFPKYALLREPDGTIWLLTSSERRHIETMEAFRKFGFNIDEVEEVEAGELESYPIGESLSEKTEFPQGVLLQDPKSGGIWYVENNVKYSVPSKIFLSLYFRGRPIKKSTTATLETYVTGTPYRLHEGELVRTVSEPAVYVVENNGLRPIPSAEVFEGMGWQWKNVVTVADVVLKPYNIGTPVELQPLAPSTPTILTSSSL
jgi:hypothetical protein